MNNVMLKHARVMSSNPNVHFVHLGSYMHNGANVRVQVFLRIVESQDCGHTCIRDFEWVESHTTQVKHVHTSYIAQVVSECDIRPSDLDRVRRIDMINPYSACVLDKLLEQIK